MADYNSIHTGAEIDQGTTTSLKLNIKVIDASDNTQWDNDNQQPTDPVIQDIANTPYDMIKVINVPVFEGVSVIINMNATSKLDTDTIHQAQYYRFDEGRIEQGQNPCIEVYTFTNEEEDPTDYKMVVDRHEFATPSNSNSNED